MFNKTIEYDFKSLDREFKELILEFSLGMEAEKIRSALGKNFIKQIIAEKKALSDRLQQDFSLVVVGNFKRGKSTLINALLGEEIVTTNVTPETVTINEISYGDRLEIQICLLDGGKIKLEPKELHSDLLNPIVEQLADKISHLSIKAPVPWLKGICLVDTPGTGDIFNRFDRQVHDYLQKADAVIVVISALSPLSSSEQAFLNLSIFPQDFPKLFFVLNMLDFARSNEEAERLLKFTSDKILSVFPQARMFGVSALDEFSRLKSLPRDSSKDSQILEKRFQSFRSALEESILLNRDLIQLSRVASQMEENLRHWQSSLALLRQALQSDRVDLGKAIAQCENRSSQLYANIEQHKQKLSIELQKLYSIAKVWLDEFVQRLENEAIAAIPRFKISELQRHYHFFLTDSLRQALSQCLDTHQTEAIELVEKTTNSIAKEIDSLIALDTSNNNFIELAVTQNWSLLDTVDWILHSFHLNFFVAPLIHLVKESSHSKESLHYQHQLQKALPELKQALSEQLQSLYQDLNSRIQEYIDTTYQQEIENSILALRQAQELGDRDEKISNATHQNLQEASSITAHSIDRLKAFQKQLWSSL
jgi:ribosome biogenesis GTPase A